MGINIVCFQSRYPKPVVRKTVYSLAAPHTFCAWLSWQKWSLRLRDAQQHCCWQN